ncbi:MAG TPA: FAD-dependent oxidoreductase [Gemmatimonadales bacterium]|nr:FAD-dependent oxidoreductase [Gemmatimonadales bacterium]
MPVPRVLCLGGGWSSLYCVRSLRRAIRRGEVEVTVVGRDNFHTFHGFIAEMLTGRIQPSQITSAARRMFPPARFHNAEIEAVDLERRVVTTARHLDGRRYELPFDHLFVALGSIDDLSRFPGIAEHALKLKTYWDCFKVRNHILAMLELAEIEPDPDERRRLLTFVVVGGGYGGIEVAAELHDYVRVLARRDYPGIDPAESRVIVVHGGARILPELVETHPRMVRYAERYLAKRGLEFRLGVRLQAATPQEALLSSGERIPTRSIISSAGTALSPLLDQFPCRRDDRGRLLTDEFTRVAGTENVWAAGDCAAVPHPGGGTCPPLAIFAMTQGRQAGRNILRAIRGKPPARYRFTGLGDACGLGRRHAIAQVKGIELTGIPAWIVWRAFFIWYVPTVDRQLRILLDWLITPFVGRDVVEVRVREPFGLRREHYETGQEIVRQGEFGQQLYLIWKGEVEVLRRTGEGVEVLARLGPGEHFGEMAVFQNVRRTATVRAVTAVEVIAVGGQEARALSQTVKPFGEAVGRTPGAPPA